MEGIVVLQVLRHPTYAKLFGAQVIALVGTGLLTVALGLLAFDIAGSNAGFVMGLAMTIKIVTYVGVAPVVNAVVSSLPAKPVLVFADVVRAGVALFLPFVDAEWQIYLLIFLLQSASATFTPTFQAVIPEVLPDERDYTRALSLSRLAYDLEAVVSPMLAAALLTVMSYNNLFLGTVVGFVGSAVLVLWANFPDVQAPEEAPFRDRLTLGARVFWRDLELRGLLGLNLVVATMTAMVIVNTVVVVQGSLGRSESDVALLLAAYGAGSMVVAFALPAVLEKVADRRVMFAGATFLPLALVASAAVLQFAENTTSWFALLVIWTLAGATTSMVLTPSSRLLRRGSTPANRSAVFAAQFSLSHACYLLTYPIAGILGAQLGLVPAALMLAVLGAAGLVFCGNDVG
ncbi:MFS family permease [Trueperella bonasi]|uniref:MFS family permease n=1 Tax=Trueperella bonasi TaxID=312286 RepID=A0ABT9NFG1_9ACTO|nr:MFS family permease [Trueperella bonasi]